MFNSIHQPLGPFAYIVLVLTIFLMLANIKKIVRGPKYSRLVGSVELIVVLYTLGMILKNTLIGPDFIRWHLADFGFVPALAGILSVPAWLANGEDRKSALVSDRIDFRYRSARTYRIFLVIATMLAIIYEYVVGWRVSALRERGQADDIHVGAFDGVDVAFYIAGGSLAFYLTTKIMQLLNIEFTAALNAEEALARETKRQRRHDPQT